MTASKQIDTRIEELGDWRGDYISKLRKLIHEADPEIEEVWKWGSPVFEHNGLVCSLGSFKDHVKLHFFKGAQIQDSDNLFNAGLEAKATRGIDFFENDVIDERKIIKLLQRGVALNAK